MSNLRKHFKAECDLLGWNDPGHFEDPDGFEWQQIIIANVNAVLDVISEQGHSGHSFPYFFNLLEKAANFKPIAPLTGEDSEWNLISEDPPRFQNNRCSNVFKNTDGAYNIDGYVFREPSGSCFTSLASRKDITFPYTPEKPVYIDVSDGAESDEQEAAVKTYKTWAALRDRLEALPVLQRVGIVAAGLRVVIDSLPETEAPNTATAAAIREQNR